MHTNKMDPVNDVHVKNVLDFLPLPQDEDVDSRAAQVRRHSSFSSRDSEKTEQQAAIKRHASSESPFIS